MTRILGIYVIRNKIDNKIYVGSSIDVNGRLSQHKKYLIRNKHPNSHLQNAWNKHGGDNFIFKLRELSLKKCLIKKEQFWIDKYRSYNRKYGYNIAPRADRTEVSDETRKKQSERLIGIAPLPVGWHHSKESKSKISKSLLGRKAKPFTVEHRKKIGDRVRGKNFEELYGSKKSTDIRERQSVSGIKRYNSKKGKKFRAWLRLSDIKKYGKKKASEIRNKRNKSNLGKHNHSKKVRKNLSVKKIGDKNPMYKNVSKSIRNRIVHKFNIGCSRKEISILFDLSSYLIFRILKEEGLIL